MIRSRFVPPPFVQLAGLVAVMFLAGPARAAEPATDAKTDETARIARLLDQIEQRMSRMDTKLDTVVDMGRELKQLREDVTKLQRDVADLRRGNSSSFYSPSQTTPPAATPTQTARVRLVNSYLTDMTAIVDGVSYTIAAGRSADVTVPTGQLTYQVLQTGQPMKVTNITANEMLTLTLFPA
jgi:hypothetical protein